VDENGKTLADYNTETEAVSIVRGLSMDFVGLDHLLQQIYSLRASK
jgi:hypothetical protein